MKIGGTIYLDHQATTPVDSRVLAEMLPFFTESFGNPHSSEHCLGWKAEQAVETAATNIAQLIGADADEIIFTSGATESNNLALLGLGRCAVNGNRRRFLISAIEHKSVLAVARILHEQLGYQIEIIPVDNEGLINISALEKMLDDNVLAVSVMAVNNEIGTIQDVELISKIVRRCGALFHCDAAQAPCAIELNSYSEHADFMSISSHKMYGPMGVGALFIRRHLQSQIEPLIYGGGQQRGLRSGTLPVALCVGMGTAATILASDAAREKQKQLHERRDKFIAQLMCLPWRIALNGPMIARRHPGNANICFKGFSAHEILSALQPHIAASTGSACTSGIQEPSYVLKAIGLTGAEAEASIRFSIGQGTTDADLEEAVGYIHNALLKQHKTN